MWHHYTLQYGGKGRAEEDCSQVNINVNNSGFNMCKTTALQKLFGEENALNAFVASQGCTQCVVMTKA